jgi:hypothetical protein
MRRYLVQEANTGNHCPHLYHVAACNFTMEANGPDHYQCRPPPPFVQLGGAAHWIDRFSRESGTIVSARSPVWTAVPCGQWATSAIGPKKISRERSFTPILILRLTWFYAWRESGLKERQKFLKVVRTNMRKQRKSHQIKISNPPLILSQENRCHI